jgi:hypothetical protein
MYYMRVCVHLVLVQIELATALAVLLLACDGADAAGTSQRTHTGCSNLSRCVWGAFVCCRGALHSLKLVVMRRRKATLAL